MTTQLICCKEDIDTFVASLRTGDLIFFTSGLFHSIISFTIEMVCHSRWTHVGMIINPESSTSPLYWESVNQHVKVSSTFIDERTGKYATGQGARLVDFRTYIEAGYNCMVTSKDKTCNFAVLRLKSLDSTFQKEIETYVLNESLKTKMVYPRSLTPLVSAWYDGWQSLFVCCGLFTTYEVEMINLQPQSIDIPRTHNHYKETRHPELREPKEDVICSQLVIKTLEHTNFFKSQIPCNEWTVQDLAFGAQINKWLSNGVRYEPTIELKILYCGK